MRTIYILNQDGYTYGLSEIIGVYTTLIAARQAIRTHIGQNDVDISVHRTSNSYGNTQYKILANKSGEANPEECTKWYIITEVTINV